MEQDFLDFQDDQDGWLIVLCSFILVWINDCLVSRSLVQTKIASFFLSTFA